MSWESLLTLMFVSLLFLLLLGLPIAFAFMVVVLIGYVIFIGGWFSISQFLIGMFSSTANFSLSAVPLFIMMGEILFRTGIALKGIEGFSKWLAKVPARLSILTIISGAFFAALSGSTVANTAMFSTLLLPEMDKERYSRRLSLEAVMAGGGLAMIIPPSALAVIYAAIAQVSVAGVLVAGIIPGIIMSIGYIITILIRYAINPHIAPSMKKEEVSVKEMFKALLIDILPLLCICMGMLFCILFGITTPTEAGTIGVVGSLILALAYKKLNINVLMQSIINTMVTTAMIFFITCTSNGFSQLIAYSGAASGLLNFVTSLNVEPIILIIAMLLVVLLLGCFMDQVAIMMITIPIFVPLVSKLGFDPIWFAVLFLIAVHEGLITPPFGLELFVVKSIAPDVRTEDLYASILPIIVVDLSVIALILMYPDIALWLVKLGTVK